MKLWIDDIRTMPEGYDCKALTAGDAIEYLESGLIEHVSFDHDLGIPEAGTGYDVAKWIEEQAFHGRLDRVSWSIHSANPVGRDNITRAMDSAERYWDSI